VNYDTLRQHLNFDQTGFWYSPSFVVTRILPPSWNRPEVPYGVYLCSV